MKNVKVLFVCFMMIFLTLTGCKSGTNNPQPAEPIFDVAVYDEVLSSVKEALTLPEDAVVPENMEAIREFGAIYGEEALEKMCYQYRDVNRDGMPELLIGVSIKEDNSYLRNQIYQVYTVVLREPMLMLSSNYKNSYSLLTNDHFGYFGSASASQSFFGEYALEENGVIRCTSFMFTHEVEENPLEIAVYKNNSGMIDTDLSEWTNLTVREYEDYMEEMTLRTLPLTEDATPFSNLL